MTIKLDKPRTDIECRELWENPPKIEDKPIFSYDPNDCCFNLNCETCGGRVWLGESNSIAIGDEVGIAWYAPRYESPEAQDVMWGIVAGKEMESYYFEPEGGWVLK